MKMAMSLILIFASLSTWACPQEAQFTATVSSKLIKGNSCELYIQAKDFENFNPSLVCPLHFSEVVDTAISFNNSNSYYCELEEGDMLSGVLVKTQEGLLTID